MSYTQVYANDAWNEAMTASHMLPGSGKAAKGDWSSLGFFALALGGPWLVYKLISRIVNSVEGKLCT